jgi:hypothetical protein
MAETYGNLAGLTGGGTRTQTSTLNDPARALMDLIGSTQFPQRLAGWQSALSALTERASGTPESVDTLINPQLQQMARQILQSNAQISRTFGPYGGKQIPTAQGQAMAGQNFVGSHVAPVVQAGQQRMNFLQGTGIGTPTGQNTTDVIQKPVNLAEIAEGFQKLFGAASGAYGAARKSGMFDTTPTSGTLPTTWDAYRQGGSANTAYAPFGIAPSMSSPGVGFGPAQGYPYL